MLRTAQRAHRSYEARMLAAADRLFAEFDTLPVMTVIRAIGSARSSLRADDALATPEAVEAIAREQLLTASAASAA